MTREEIENAAKHFAKNFYFSQSNDWEQIFQYEEHIPAIITHVVDLMLQSDMFEGYDKNMLYHEIIEQIEKVKENA